MKLFVWSVLLMHGASGVEIDRVSVSVMEGDSVTLHTDVKTKQRDRIRWYFNDTRIAQITGDLSKTCTDVQCNEDTERFRDRLKLDHQTGSLTIMNIRNTDSGDYHLETIISGSISEKIFNVTITGGPGSKAVQMKRTMEMKGASDTLNNGEAKTSGSDDGDEAPVLSAIKTSASDQYSGNLRLGVTVGVILVLVMAVGVIYCRCRKHKQKRRNVSITHEKVREK
ncbi:uncharacterized protein LOC122141489 isoform X1 [Cyprinus carpio]|uniref:Uncharacterized protein LOC122141489 isoform X1 n=2 Tax=Cyprinus carpio TaxID=7962 RepID=A0A9R0AN40_CYPCA|nr:uncharacterized protein LOC122141489 isoform X1 [Cyprinus carpio]